MSLCKEEQLNILKQLLFIADVSHNCENMIDNKTHTMSDDKERYLKMAIKIDPNDSDVLDR